MGFGKFIGGTLLAVGAVIAAPLVVPALGATAIGGAIVTGAAAVGEVAAAAGTAITSTAIGGAVAGATTTVMAGVGTTVGIAAEAVGLSSVAAVTGTTAGAAALGTIATTGAVGVASGVSGAAKLSEASDIKEKALQDYNAEKQTFERKQANTNRGLEALGKLKLQIWESFGRFEVMYSKIQNPPKIKGTTEIETIELSPGDLDNIKAVTISVKNLLSGGAGSVSAGGLIGMATSGGLASSITMASTGTAISSLSGAAATNATLAAFGGGSLAVGGAGMAGGAAVLGGLTFTPMLMVGGIALNSHAKKSLDTAKDIESEADSAIEKMKAARRELSKVAELGEEIRTELEKLYAKYKRLIGIMEDIVSKKTDYRQFTIEEKKTLEKTILVLKLLKQVSMQNILDNKNGGSILESEVQSTLSYSEKAYQKEFAS